MAIPTTVMAGITVPFTPLIQDAIAKVKAESPPWMYHHVMRAWLFAVKLAAAESHIATNAETLALATILHDMGLVPKYMTSERRFEVDGAAAAVEFVKERQTAPSAESVEDYQQKLREVLIWQAIALHATSSIVQHASPEAMFCHRGTAIDAAGFGLESLPGGMDTVKEVLAVFPRLDIGNEFKTCLCALAREKPKTTYDNFVGAFGTAYVDGYTRSGEEEAAILKGMQMNPLDG